MKSPWEVEPGQEDYKSDQHGKCLAESSLNEQMWTQAPYHEKDLLDQKRIEDKVKWLDT